MTQVDVAAFWEWFDSVRGDLSNRQIEERAGVPRGRIGNRYGKKPPSHVVCEAIADGLGLRREEVFRRGGHLPQRTTDALIVSEILDYLDMMDNTDRLRLVTIAFALAHPNRQDGTPAPE